jgi:hypothetical protein
MQGYLARKGERCYAVIYEGIDRITGRERRRSHPTGTDRAAAERSRRSWLTTALVGTVASAPA